MRLTVEQNGKPISDLKFEQGPIYVGRQLGSQVFLPEVTVSRQHAVIYRTKSGTWVIEDLDSANKTFINNNAIHKHNIQNGDLVRIADFAITIELDGTPAPDELAGDETPGGPQMEDTIIEVRHDVHTIIRRLDGRDAPKVALPAKRMKHFAHATINISHADTLKQLHRELLDAILSQFAAHNAWTALRLEPEGPLDCQGGRMITSEAVKRSDLLVQQSLAEAMDKCRYLLIPDMPRQTSDVKIRSAIIAPVIKNGKCHGALYADNTTDHEHYTMADLDYLILLSIHAGAVLEYI